MKHIISLKIGYRKDWMVHKISLYSHWNLKRTSSCHFIDLQFFDLLTRSDYSDIKQWFAGL